MTKTYKWTKDAEKAIREHFIARNQGRGIHNRRIRLRKPRGEILPNGDIAHTYTYKGESVTMTRKAYNVEVNYG